MTKDEAKQAMREGKKVTHRYFTPDEWVKSDQDGVIYILEDGVELTAREFWKYRTNPAFESDWQLFENYSKSIRPA